MHSHQNFIVYFIVIKLSDVAEFERGLVIAHPGTNGKQVEVEPVAAVGNVSRIKEYAIYAGVIASAVACKILGMGGN